MANPRLSRLKFMEHIDVLGTNGRVPLDSQILKEAAIRVGNLERMAGSINGFTKPAIRRYYERCCQKAWMWAGSLNEITGTVGESFLHYLLDYRLKHDLYGSKSSYENQ